METNSDCQPAIKYLLGSGSPWNLGVISIIECSNQPAQNVSAIEKATDEICSPNADLVGIGVVVAFIAGSGLCALCAIALAALDSILGRNRILPGFIQDRINTKFANSDTRVYEIWRRTLERTLLSLGDQQLVTGLSLGIAFLVGFFKAVDELWPQSVIFPEGLLTVYIAALSSSSHLACLTTLRGYFVEHQGTFYIRLVLILFYNLMFIAGIYKTTAFSGPLFALLVDPKFINIPTGALENVPVSLIVILPVVYLFYTSTLQNAPWVKARIQYGIDSGFGLARRATVHTYQKLLEASRACIGRAKTKNPNKDETATSSSPTKPIKERSAISYWITAATERAFWSLLLGSPGYNFLLQQASFAIALVFTIAQKWVPRPSPPHLVPADGGNDSGSEVWNSYCVLYGESVENVIDFGQLLPILLLFLPFLTLIETFFEAREEVPPRQKGEDESVRTMRQGPPVLDTDQSTVSQEPTKGHGGTVSAVQQRSLEEQLPCDVGR